jgi:hypothetical protein
MFRRLCLSVVLLSCSMAAWCQVEPSASGGSGTTTDDDTLMTLPPSVSGSFYPSSVGSEERENTLSGGITVIAAYNDNVLTGESIQKTSAESYTILPNITMSAMTSRLRGSLTYSPGFIFYHPTTELNQATQNAVADFQYRWTPHTTVGVQEMFQQNSSVFSEPYIVAGSTVSESGSASSPLVILPYLGQLMESTTGHINYQLSRSSMVSASGYYSLFDYSSSALSQGFYDSHSGGGSGSFSRRFGRSQYFGVSYRYAVSKTTTYPSTTESQYATAFYSIRLPSHFSLSFNGGPEYTSTTAPGVAPFTSWAPSGTASAGWQRNRADFALSYSHEVTTGWGLLGSFTADTASFVARLQFTRRLTGGLNGNYSNTKNATPLITAYTPVGHTLFGRASLDYKLGEHLDLVGEYSRLHDYFQGIAGLSNDPNADRVSISLNYGFRRPLGR